MIHNEVIIMATYKGIGYDNTTGKTRTGTSADDISFDAQVTATDGVVVTGNIETTTLSTTADASIGGDLTVIGDIVSRGTENLVVQDPMIDLGLGNDGTTASAGGYSLSMNRNAGFSIETVTACTAGNSPTGPQITVSASSNFSAGDVLCLTGSSEASNDGLYTVLTASGTTITLEGTGGTAISGSLPFSQNNLTTTTGESAKAYKVDLYVQAVAPFTADFNDAGGSPYAKGTLVEKFASNARKVDFNANGSYTPVGESAVVTLQEAYNAGGSITTATSGDIDFNLASGNLVIDQGNMTLGATTPTNFTMDGGDATLGGGTALGAFALQTNNGSAGGIVLAESNAGGSIQMSVNSALVLEAKAGALDLSTDITLDKSGSQSISKLSVSAGDDLKIGLTGANDASVILESAGTGNDAIRLDATAGGFDIGGAIDSKILVTTGGLNVGTFTSGDLTLSTTTAGAIVVNSAEGIDLNASGALTADSTSFSIDATGASNVSTTGADLTVSTLTSGNVVINSVANVDLDAVDFDIDVSGSFDMLAQGNSNVSVASGDLSLSTTTSGELDITSAGLLDINAGANLDIDATGTMALNSTDTANFTMTANDVGAKVLSVSATNGGGGDARVDVSATTTVKLVTGGADRLLANANGINLGGSSVSVNTILDDDAFTADSDTALATQQSIKAYVDGAVGATDSLAEVLAIGNTSGGTGLVMTAGDVLTVNVINETTANAGVTIDSVLLKDDVVNATDVETSSISANDGVEAITVANATGALVITTQLGFTAGTQGVNEFSIDGTLAGDSDTAVPTEKAVKTYVDGQVSASALATAGTTGTGTVDLGTQTLSVLGTASEIETVANAQSITIGLPSAVAVTTSLNVGSTIAITGFLDSDTFTGASSTLIPTSESVKVYVDTAIAGVDQTLEIEGDSGTGSVNIATEVFDVAGTANQIVTSASGTDITVALTDAISVVTSLTAPLLVATNVQASNYKANDGTASMTIADSTGALAISTTLGLASGTTVNEFSIDGTLGGNSDDAVPTEKAVKTYVTDELLAFQGFTSLGDGSSGALSAGDVVAINNSGQAIQADATQASTANVIGICVANISGTISVQQVGNNTGVSGLTAGTKYYLGTSAGALSATAPNAVGNVVYQLGFAKGTGEIIVVPQFVMEIG